MLRSGLVLINIGTLPPSFSGPIPMSHNTYVNIRNGRLVNTPLISAQLGTVHQVHVKLLSGSGMDYSDPRRGPVVGFYDRCKARFTKCGVFLQYLMHLSFDDDSFSRG